MSQLKEIEGRYYQEAEVVMLATKQYHSDIEFDDTLQLVRHKGYANKNGQHLYIVSNEKIKESDWVVYENEVIYQNNYGKIGSVIGDEDFIRKYCKKIIATTDEYIGYTDIRVSPVKNFCIYPQPSDSFIKKYIEEYNKGNIITNVLVEYKKATYEDWIKTAEPVKDSIKVDLNNCITVKKIEPKLYTREEVEILITNAFKAGYERSHSGYPHTDNWSKPKVEEFLKENL